MVTVDYYKGLKKAVKVSPEYKKELKEIVELEKGAESKEESNLFFLLKQQCQINYLAFRPVFNMLKYRINNMVSLAMLNEIKSAPEIDAPKYRPNEIYKILKSLNPDVARYVIGELTDEPKSLENLEKAIDKKNEKLFTNTLKNGNCRISIEANRLLHYFNNFDADRIVEEAIQECDKHPEYTGEIITDAMSRLPLPENMFADFGELMQKVFDSIEKDDLSNATITLQQLVDKFKEYVKLEYYSLLQSNLSSREHDILTTITEQPEVAPYFDKWAAEYLDGGEITIEDKAEIKISKPKYEPKAVNLSSSKKERLRFIIGGLLYKDAADPRYNLKWTPAFKKWYDGNQEAFAELVKYITITKRYLEPEKSQIRAFYRTITGQEVSRAAERVELFNADKKKRMATRAIMYLKYIGLVEDSYERMLDIFDPEAPADVRKKFVNNPTGYAKQADKEYQDKVNEIFKDTLKHKSHEK